MSTPPEAAGACELQASQAAITDLGDLVLRVAWPEDIRDARQLAFDRAIESVRSNAFNSDEQDVLDFSAPQWRWRLFGQPNDPLPASLQYVRYGSWDPQVRPFTSYAGTRARDYAAAIATTYLAPFLQERAENIKQHQPEIESKAEPIVAAMPIYQLLRSFVPDKAGGIQPLTYAERLGREQEIYNLRIYEAAVNGVYIDRKDLETRPGYDTVRRPMAALDYEESIYERKDTQGDPWEKVRQLILKRILTKYEVERRSQFSVTWDSENFYIKFTTKDGTEYNDTNPIRWTVRDLMDIFHRGIPKNALFSPGEECEVLLARAFTSPPAEDYKFALAKAMATSKDELTAKIVARGATLAGWRMGYNSTGSYDEDLFHAQLSRSAGTVVSFEAFESWAQDHAKEWHRLGEPPGRDGVHFASEYQVAWNRATEVGKVRGTLDCDRLITMGLPLTDIKSEPVFGYDVEITLPASAFGNNQPLLTGYNLIAAYKRGSAHYYQYEQSTYDPMDSQGEIRAPLTAETRLRVAEMCESIGLTKMAADIRDREGCSVADLERLLRRHSKYTYENPAGEQEGPVPFESLSQYVVDGIYHCQCTGAAYLFDHLLRVVFADDPSIEVRIVNGLIAEGTIFSRSVINKAMHAENHIYKKWGACVRFGCDTG